MINNIQKCFPACFYLGQQFPPLNIKQAAGSSTTSGSQKFWKHEYSYNYICIFKNSNPSNLSTIFIVNSQLFHQEDNVLLLRGQTRYLENIWMKGGGFEGQGNIDLPFRDQMKMFTISVYSLRLVLPCTAFLPIPNPLARLPVTQSGLLLPTNDPPSQVHLTPPSLSRQGEGGEPPPHPGHEGGGKGRG